MSQHRPFEPDVSSPASSPMPPPMALTTGEEELRSPNRPLAAASVCPALHLRDDPATHALYPTDRHRCAAEPGYHPDQKRQRSLCLTATFDRCPYRRQESPTGPRLFLARLRHIASQRGLASAIAAIVILGGASAVAVQSLRASEPETGGGAVPAASSTAPAIAGPAQNPTVTPDGEPTMAPTEAATPLREATPTTTPTPVPTATREALTHVVREGDSLLGLAELYDVPIARLLDANGLALDDPLFIDQVLMIPGVAGG